MRFWNYHEQTGWRNAKGQRIVNKKSAAQFWRIDEQNARRQSELVRKITSRFLSAIPQEQRICFIAELQNIYQEGNVLVFIISSDKIIHLIEDNPKVLNAGTRILQNICGKGTRVEYKTKTEK